MKKDIKEIKDKENIKNKIINIIKIYKKINNIPDEEKLDLDEEKRELKKIVKKLEKDKIDLEEENELIKLNKEKVEEFNKQLKIEIEQIKLDISKLEEKNERLNKDKINLEENKEELKIMNKELTWNMDILKERNLELRHNLENLNKEKDKLKEEKDKLKEEKDKIKEEKDNIKEKKDKLNEELLNEKEKNDYLESELKDKKEELYKERINSDDLKNQIEMNKSKNKNLENDYYYIKSENDKLLKNIKNIESKNDENIKKLQKENENLKSEAKNTKSKQLDLEKQIKEKSNLIEKKTKEYNNLKEELTEERKKRFELEDKLDKKDNENNTLFYQTYNKFNQRDTLTNRRSGRNNNYYLDSLNNERDYNNLSFTARKDTCFKCSINSEKLEKLNKENNSLKKKIDDLEKKNKMLTSENNKLSEIKNQTENNDENDYENKSLLINHIIEKGFDPKTRICDKYNLGNKFLIIELIQKGYITSEKVADVMLEVDRGDFAPNYPYANRPISINYNVTISAPHMHAFALEYLSEYCIPYSKILDVGSGSGFLTLALSKMTNDKAKVIGIEHIPELYDFGIQNVEKSNAELIENKTIIFVKGDGRQGCKNYAPYKAIHVGAASEFLPKALVDQLDYNGRMFIPIGKKGQSQNRNCFSKR